jgi:single-stranded-DNA-specific exonuclease
MLNAPGRLGEASRSFDLLVGKGEREATEIARDLARVNRKRQAIQRSVLADARARMRDEVDLGRPAIVLAAEGWHPGVTGIVAGQLARESDRPTILIALEGEIGRGSARCFTGVSLPDVLEACDDLLRSHGGHARAAGLVVGRGDLDAFRQRVWEILGREEVRAEPPPLEVDAEVDLSELGPRAVQEMGRLAPFGEGNPPPVLLARRCRVVGEVRRGRRGSSFFIRQGDVALRAHLGNGIDPPARTEGPGKLTVAFRPGMGKGGEADLEVVDFSMPSS